MTTYPVTRWKIGGVTIARVVEIGDAARSRDEALGRVFAALEACDVFVYQFAEGLSSRALEQSEQLKQQLAEADKQTLSKREEIEKLKADLKAMVGAWTVEKGAKAPQAAGVIHTDFERGFIKAETVAYDDLVKCGSVAAAREKGLYRMEGKEYVVKDGDVMNFLFSS